PRNRQRTTPDFQYWQGHLEASSPLGRIRLLAEQPRPDWIVVHNYLCCICLRQGMPAADEMGGLQGAKECPVGLSRTWPRRSGEFPSTKCFSASKAGPLFPSANMDFSWWIPRHWARFLNPPPPRGRLSRAP